MKKKDWFAKKIKSDVSTTPFIESKFITTATLVPNPDVKYVDFYCETEKLKEDIDKLSKKILALENKVEKISDDVIFLSY